MRTIGLLLLTCFLLLNSNLFAQEIRAEFATARFDSPDDGPYLETYLKLKGASLQMVEEGGELYAEVLVTCQITKAGNTVFEDLYKVKGPSASSKDEVMDFIDQQRIPVKMGKHELVMTIKDLHNPDAKEAKIKQEVTVQQKLLGVFLSDIELVDSYTNTVEENMLSKAGYDLVPYTSNYYRETQNELSFYVEAYNTHRKIGTDEDFLINLFIENADDGKVVNGLRNFFKRKGALVVPILHSFQIDNLVSGNYNLIVEARDKKNELLDRQVVFFQRNSGQIANDYVQSNSNAYVNGVSGDWQNSFVAKYNRPEELEEYLRCLHPISTQDEITRVNRKMNFNDPEMMKEFMYNFWIVRNPLDPETAWNNYWKEVLKVNATYTTNLNKGYDTDRGRVYLQYGAPNTIAPKLFEPNTYPYEIWHYYTLQDPQGPAQTNKKFIFANTDQGSKEYELIHSDAKNEITNRRWHYDLYKRSNSTIDLDQESGGQHYGSQSQDLYDNPY